MFRFGKLVKSIIKNERGAVLPLVALLIIFLFGMAALTVDAGGLYAARREMVNTADAAALAGAQELAYANTKGLSDEQVKSYAEQFAIENYNGDLIEVEATIINDHTVGVRTVREVDFTFARVMGFTTSEVPAYAEATFTPLAAAAKIVPWGVPASYLEGLLPEECEECECECEGEDGCMCQCDCEGQEECDCGEVECKCADECVCCTCDQTWCEVHDCTLGTEDCDCDIIILKHGPPAGGNIFEDIGAGNFHSLALGGPGADTYESNIINGYEGEIEIGDELDTQTGNIAGKTVDGVMSRVNQCDEPGRIGPICGSYGASCDRNCARFVVCPVIEGGGPGKTTVTVVGFVTVWLVDASITGGSGGGQVAEVRARFVEEYIASGEGTEGLDPSADFGTYNLRLIE